MSEDTASYRSLLRATGLVGGASVVVLIIGLFRAKAFALLVGPTGIGLLGLLSTLIATAAAIGGMGLNTSAVRELARDGADQRTVRAGIWSLAWLLAVIAGCLVWLLRHPLSMALTGAADMSGPIGWSALAVALTVLVATQTAVFQGLRRLGAMAQTNIGGTLIGSLLSIAAVYLWRETGIVAAAVVIPLCIAAAGWLRIRSVPAAGTRPTPAEAMQEWRPLLHLGVGVVVTAALGTISQLALRSIVLRDLGIEGVGLLQAAIAISTINVGLVLTAMAADFFPRLSRVADDSAAMSTLLERQLHLAIVLSAPILIALSAGAAFWLRLLYSGAFVDAANLLRVQLASEVLRVPVWAFGYVLLARGDRRGYVLNELTFTISAIAVALWLVPSLGLVGAGAGYAVGYAAALIVCGLRARRLHQIRVGAGVLFLLAALLASCSILFAIGTRSPSGALIIGAVLALFAGLWALRELHRNNALAGWQ